MKIFDAIQQVIPCPKTRSLGCQCDRLESIAEAEETIKAIAQLEHTIDDVQGAVKFKQTPGQPTIIKGIIKGLTPGKHGFHIHEFGDLSKGCESAGGHYNPDGVDHGSLQQGHVGDLGNIVADKLGIARFQIKAERVELKDVVGRAIVIHADEDDLGQGGDEESTKTGNAGDRVGCGVIRLREVMDEQYQRKMSDKHFDRNQMPQVNKPDLDNSPFTYKRGQISISNIKPVQTQRVQGLSKKAQDIFLNNEDKPFIVDKNGYLINGHHRYDAAHMLGLKKVDAIMVDAEIEDIMNHFSHITSDRDVMPEHYFKSLYEKKLKAISETIEASQDIGALMKGIEADLKQREEDLKKLPKKSIYSEDVVDGNFPKQQHDREMQQGIERELKMYKVLERLAQMWWNNDMSPAVEQKLADMGWEVGEDEGSDTPSVFVIEIGDENGNSYISWPIEQLEKDVVENFADGKKKGKSRPGRVKKSGASCNGSVTSLRKKAKNSSGEKAKMYHWCANMKSGKKKS
jgi:Cu/Zn superoxide dismutase